MVELVVAPMTALPEPTDEILWRGLQDRVEADFAFLFRRYNKLVYNFCFRATASWALAEDLTQATFATLWRRACEGRVDPLRRQSAAPILLSMARHEVLNSARGGKRRLRLARRIGDEPGGPQDNVGDWLAQEAGMARVRQVLAQLPENQRAVIELVVWSGLELAECAEVLGVPVGTVKSRLSRARQKLATTEVARLLGGDEG
ncbi:RNA polymerase sigma factor [Enemella evansiae]|uniref:RNA polymerase sigma factor n=1 Tax=Enemella evansiae TaxID=2016499 RepID=UPI0010CEBCC1|nr:sigma-70 family RNA polymerase sigma factor [Enemella evansiae]TDO89897.1 RNA polymerase ECF family sigma subunit [Enemella evansiae]